jgi:hypothetical protein
LPGRCFSSARSPRVWRRWPISSARRARADEVAQGESAETIPEPGWAPLIISLGVGGLALGAAFGPWLTIAGLLVAIAGGASWLSAAIREARSAHGSLPPDPDGG